MTFYEQAQKQAEMAFKMLFNLMASDNRGYLDRHPIRPYLNENTVELNVNYEALTFKVGAHTFIIEPQYVMFQGANNTTEVYLNTYEKITDPLRLLMQGQPRIYRLNEIAIEIESSGKYGLPNIKREADKPWYIQYFDHVVEYIRNRATQPEYEILQEEDADNLFNSVFNKMQEGWMPVGSASAISVKLNDKSGSPDNDGEARSFYLQAIVK